MKIFKILKIVSFCGLLSGCAIPAPEQQRVFVSGDQFSSTIDVEGVKGFENPFGGTSKIWFIRSQIDKKTGALSHQLYVTFGYRGDWRFYERASDEDAKNLETTMIDRNVVDCSGYSCSFDETVGVEISNANLKAHARNGYSIKIYSHSGDAEILKLSPFMIQKQFATIRQTVAPYMKPKR